MSALASSSPRSTSATRDESSSVASTVTPPVSHATEVHISESANATSPSPARLSPCASASVVDSTVHSLNPVTRTYGVPDSQPATSFIEPMAVHTVASAFPPVTVIVTASSTRPSTPGSVTTYRVPETDASAVISRSGFQIVAFSTPSTMQATAITPRMGVTTKRMILARRDGAAGACGSSCSRSSTVITTSFYRQAIPQSRETVGNQGWTVLLVPCRTRHPRP